MKSRKEKTNQKKKINIPPAVLVLLLIAAIAIGVFFIIREGRNVNSAYSIIRNLYTLLFK